jgi:hypothetical protein
LDTGRRFPGCGEGRAEVLACPFCRAKPTEQDYVVDKIVEFYAR